MNRLLALAYKQVGNGYWWGAQGEPGTKETLDRLISWFGIQHYVFDGVNANKWIGKPRCFDCSGLVLWCLQQLGFIGGNEDYGADTFYHKFCTPITKDQLQPGDLVFIDPDGLSGSKSITHIGIYAGDGKTVEAKGTSAGVVEGTLHGSYNVFGRLKFDIGNDQPEVIEKPIGAGTVINVSAYLNIRSGPAATYDDIGDLYNGNAVPIFEERNGWYRIGVSKWVCGDYINFVPNRSDVDVLVDEMLTDGIVTDRQYWTDVLDGKIAPNPEYLKIAFKRSTDKIR